MNYTDIFTKIVLLFFIIGTLKGLFYFLFEMELGAKANNRSVKNPANPYSLEYRNYYLFGKHTAFFVGKNPWTGCYKFRVMGFTSPTIPDDTINLTFKQVKQMISTEREDE